MYKERTIIFSDSEIQSLNNYYGFASEKERVVIHRIMSKRYQISEWDESFLRTIIRRYKVLIEGQAIKTDSALKKWREGFGTRRITQDNTKFI